MTPKVRNTVARKIVRDLRDAGVEVDPLLEEARLARYQVNREDGWISYDGHARLLEAAARAFKDPYYGLHLARKMETKEFGALAYVGLASKTLEDALQNLERYLLIQTEAWRISHSRNGKTVVIDIHPADPEFSHQAQAAENGVAAFINTYQHFLGRSLAPLEVGFVHTLKAPRQKARIEKLLGCPVKFSRNRAQLLLDAKTLSLPIKTADDRLLKILRSHCSSMLKELRPQRSGLVAEVQKVIVELMPKGRAKAKNVADQMGLAERTLHRRLDEEGLTFGELHDKMRHNLAEKYIRDPRLTVKQVAFLLGYNDQSAFGTAYRRWTGQTPGEARVQA